jgi:hypothetical protein
VGCRTDDDDCVSSIFTFSLSSLFLFFSFSLFILNCKFVQHKRNADFFLNRKQKWNGTQGGYTPSLTIFQLHSFLLCVPRCY